ncbi:MAG: SGNH/GDSL hydrolase family protein, partial [Myxococcota bacterium]
RDREYPVEKPAGGLRVVVLGDSIGFGYCTARELLPLPALFHERMEATLEQEAASGTPVEFLNLSVSGYGTEEEIALLEARGLAFDPDLVVVAYCLNDDASYRHSEELRGLERDPRYRRARELAAGIRRSLLLESHLVRAVALRTGALARGEPESELRSGAGDHAGRVARQLEPLRELSELQGFEVLLVLFPHLHRQQDGVYAEAARHQVILGAAQEQGFHVLDLLPAFLQAGGGELARLAGRCQAMHPDEEGHRVAAQAILEYARGADLLPSPSASEAD